MNDPSNLLQSILLRIRSDRSCRTQVFSSVAAGLLAASFVFSSTAALADSVTLKNGDHLTGTVTQLAGGKLTVTTSYAGAVVISWDEVTSVKLDKPLVLPVETKVGKQISIKKVDITGIDRTDSGFVVATAAGPQPVPSAELTTLRDAAAQAAYEASIHPNILHGWTGGANVSFALARGNSETTSVGTGVNLDRPTRTDKTSLYFNTIYTHDGITDTTTAETTNAGLRYDHNLNSKVFAFGTTDFSTNELQNLDLRTVAGGGFGWHAVNNAKRQFDVLGGVVWTHESYSAPIDVTPAATPETNSFAALDVGQQYTQKFGKTTTFTEQAYFFPDLKDTSQYRATLNSGLSTKINSWLSWQTSFNDVFVTNPPPSTKENDVILTTGLGFSFTRK